MGNSASFGINVKGRVGRPQRKGITGPPPPAGFHAGSPSHPLSPARPVNVLTSKGRPAPAPRESVREAVRQ